MKQKDVIYAVLAGIIFCAAGYIGYTQLVPKSSASTNGEQVDKVGVIPSQLDAVGLARISDSSKVINYNSAPDLSGLGNPTPFGQ
jgi:hypothetical protein